MLEPQVFSPPRVSRLNAAFSRGCEWVSSSLAGSFIPLRHCGAILQYLSCERRSRRGRYRIHLSRETESLLRQKFLCLGFLTQGQKSALGIRYLTDKGPDLPILDRNAGKHLIRRLALVLSRLVAGPSS